MAQLLKKEKIKKETATRFEDVEKAHISPREANKIITRKLLRPFIVITITAVLLLSFETVNHAVFIDKYSSQISSELGTLGITNIPDEISLKCPSKRGLVIDYQSRCFVSFEQKGLNYDTTRERLLSNNWKLVEETTRPTEGGYGKHSSYTKNGLKASIYADSPNNARLNITANQ